MRGYTPCVAALTLAVITFMARPVYAQPAPQPATPQTKTTEPASSKKLTAMEWETSFAAALTKAQAIHKPVMVVFSATWCPACHFFTDTTCKNARVIDASDSFVNVQVNVDKQAAIAKRYGATATPSIVWIDSSGRVLNGMEGVGPVSEFLQEMQLALDQFNALPAPRQK